LKELQSGSVSIELSLTNRCVCLCWWKSFSGLYFNQIKNSC